MRGTRSIGSSALDLLAAVGRLQLLELARLDEHVALERADRLVVGIEARLQPRRRASSKCSAERANRLVQVAAELADLPGVLLHRLLLPAVGDGPQQRDQRRRARRDDLALDAELDERRVLLERGAEEHLARQEHDDELGARRDVGEVALGAELREMRAHLTRVIGEQRLPRGLVGRLERSQVGVERHLGVDDDVLAAGQAGR